MTRAATAALTLLALVAGAQAQSVTPIANIQANPASYTGQTVTVEGSVTLPINYRGPTQYNGYIQDGSGRGIDLFGGTAAPPNASALNTIGTAVRVTGEVAIYQVTTIELINISEVTVLSSGAPVAPIQLTTGAANAAQWEGTFIEVSGNVISSVATGATARNYTIDDGSGPIIARVYNSLAVPVIADGTHVTARGAGTYFSPTYEFYVGQASDIVQSTPTADTQPPTLPGAWQSAANRLKVTFSEAMEPASAGLVTNYQVFETDNPSTTVAVDSVRLAGPIASLKLGSNLAGGTGYTLTVSNVRDVAGNLVGSPLARAFVGAGSTDVPPSLVSATAPTLTSVLATFSEAIDPVTGGTASNYSIYETATPGNTVAVMSVTVSTSTASLGLGGSLTAGTNYTLRAQGVQDLSGNPMPAPQTATFSASGGPAVTPIATIQGNPTAYDGQVVTVQGQVYIPSNYRGTTTSGYIQDGSGRGINVFGSTANVAALQNVGNVVRLTGTIDIYFTTVEITSLTEVTLVSSGNPPLQPVSLTTGQAASSQWEGTFIEVRAPVISSAASGPGRNYTVNDNSGPIDVRVVDPLGVAVFADGTTIKARGAGGQFGTTYQVNVGRATDVFEDTGGSDTTPPSLAGATAPSLTSVVATFSEPVTAATGGNAANYQVYPTSNPSSPVAISGVTLAGDRRSATLALGASMTAGTNYTLRVASLTDDTGNTTSAALTATFTPSVGPAVTPIATIQGNPTAYDGQVVTVQGQVYIPSNYRGTTTSGYIQDGSGRGINVFGSTANVAALQNVGNVVRLTGTIDIYFTTVEITSLTEVTLVSSGNPPLQPVSLTTGQAASSQWEGTFIEVRAPVISSAASGPGRNYTVNDGSGPIDARVVDPLGVAVFADGTTIKARGAGGQFGTTYQVNVGRATDVFEDTGGSDTTPPSLAGATAPSLTSVQVNFSEPVTAATGGSVSNYSVYETSNQTATVPVASATLSGDRRMVTLGLGGSLVDARSYTVRVASLTDDVGNTTTAALTTTFMHGGGPTVTPIATIQGNPTAYDAQVVTVQGQVYIPSNYRGTTTSGYIQDGSGRGINVFGSTANVAALQNVGNVVRLTGTIDIYFTTVEITSLTEVTLVSSGNPPLQPVSLTTGQAASSQWEGTFIEVRAPVISSAASGPGRNYTVNDGSGPIDARVVDPLGVAVFADGTTIKARGAGGQFGTTYQVNVGRATDVFEDSGGSDTTPPSLTGATAPSLTSVQVNFNEPVTAGTGGNAANYQVYPSATPSSLVPIGSVTLGSNRRSATLALGDSMTSGTSYTVRVASLTDDVGNTTGAALTTSFTALAGGITPIATIQNNLRQYKGRSVTVRGQVYIPSNYRGSTTSGYIQDESARGINVFGSSANNALLQNIGNIVTVTAVVDTYFTTVELVSLTNITLVSGGNPPLKPAALSTRAAASSAWEGTYILCTGTITDKGTTGTPATAINYTIDDGSGPIVARVVNTVGATEFNIGQTITAQGAGSEYSPDFQILVGASTGIFEGPPDDVYPPTVMKVLSTGPQTLQVVFNEAVSPAAANMAGNYRVFRTSAPADTIAVTSAQVVEGSKVNLGLASELDVALGWSVRVTNVADALGNTIPPAGVSHIVELPSAESVTLSGPPYTFLPRQDEVYPITFTVTEDVAAGSGEVLLRIFDLRGQLKRTLFDSRFDNFYRDAFTNNRATRNWDGRDDQQQIVPAGTYVVHLLVTPKPTGNREQKQIPVVVATRLNH